MTVRPKNNIVLIGMAGAGKSTVGRELARRLGRSFVDVDHLIEEDQVAPLQEVLTTLGAQGFRRLEEHVLLSMDYTDHVVATGGSAIYSQAGMEHLRCSATMVLLDVSLAILLKRVGDFSRRGLVKSDSQSFAQVFAERAPLYRKHADLILGCSDLSVSDICQALQRQI